MTKTQTNALETLRAAGGSLPMARNQKGFNLKAVEALIASGVLVLVDHPSGRGTPTVTEAS